MISELHESILGPTLANLPHLTSLHVVGCPRAEHTVVLRHISHLINLESLSITVVVRLCSVFAHMPTFFFLVGKQLNTGTNPGWLATTSEKIRYRQQVRPFALADASHLVIHTGLHEICRRPS